MPENQLNTNRVPDPTAPSMQSTNNDIGNPRSRRIRKLLVIEAVVCFAPLLAFLVLGVAMVPLQVALLFHANTLPFLGLVAGGCAGVLGVARLLSGYLEPRTSELRWVTFACIVSGWAAFGYFLYESVSGRDLNVYDVLLFGPALFAGAHVLYVTRRYWFDTGSTSHYAKDRKQ